MYGYVYCLQLLIHLWRIKRALIIFMVCLAIFTIVLCALEFVVINFNAPFLFTENDQVNYTTG